MKRAVVCWAFGLLSALAVSAPTPAHAREVVVFPIAARGIGADRAARATDALRDAMRAIPDIRAIDTGVVEAKLGVHLIEQAQACRYDVFCLVEVGEILHSERMIIGHVGANERGAGLLELKLFVLDVRKSQVVDTIAWTISAREGVLEEAVRTAAKKLFQAPDAKLRLILTPPNAEVRIFGELLPRGRDGATQFWAGEYDVEISAEGFQPLERRLSFPQGGPTTYELELEPDLLYVKQAKVPNSVTPFNKASRREGGSGVSAGDVGTDAPGASNGSPFANPFAWSLAGAGVVASAVGIVVTATAQKRYNTRAGDVRYLGDTPDVEAARREREDARGRFRTGSIIAASGAAVAGGGLLWMLVESLLEKPPSVRRSSFRAQAGGFEVTW